MAAWYPFMFLWPALGVVFWLLVFGGIGFLVYAAVARARRSLPTSRLPEDPIALLRLRYARGDLTRKEFQRMREDLEGNPRP
jgi:putative membrane protein